MKILILYTRLTGYWMACMRYDHQLKGNEFLVIRKAPSAEAPFKIASEPGINILDGDALSSAELLVLAKEFQPDVLYLSGWTDTRYLKLALHYKTLGLPVITGMDNQWLGNVRQRIGVLLSKWRVLKYFTHIWVPGKPQYYFARKLGFSPKNILTGLYCADETIFKNIEQATHNNKMVFVGRLVEHKGLKVLFKVLEQLIKADTLNIDVHIIGSGPLERLIPVHKKIKHTPFVEPDDIPALLENGGTFLLPSLYEAWGVVIHEATLAGMPILTTHQTGAGTELVIHGFNGYVYNALDAQALRKYINHISTLTTEDYLKMSGNSKTLASKINFSQWSAMLNSIIK
ncbi:glycosyltransferase [Algibacter sp.]|nr:glycosyltransferase [Algibacter sp.]MDB4273904.1 glycosyltransferase [Algibacter sp.]